MMASSGKRAKYPATLWFWLSVSAVVACLGSHAADAADLTFPIGAASPAPLAPVPWLFGDWDGARTRLQNAGIDFQFGYTSEIAGNATGGQRRQAAYTDQWTFGTTFDLTKLGVVPGGTIQVTWTDRNGSNLSDDADLGTLQQVQEVFGRGQTCGSRISGTTRNSLAARSTGRSGGSRSARTSQRSPATSRT